MLRRSRPYFVRKPYGANALLAMIQHAIGEARNW
jgi:hypothetical protein